MTTKTELLRTIKNHCTECCGGNVLEVKLCTVERCPLYSFRFGKDPNPARKFTNFRHQVTLQRDDEEATS